MSGTGSGMLSSYEVRALAVQRIATAAEAPTATSSEIGSKATQESDKE
jgi:hypothetical protein